MTTSLYFAKLAFSEMLAPCPHYTIPPPSCQAFFALVSRPAGKALQRPRRAAHKPGTQSSRREPHPPPAPWGGGAPREDAAGQTRRAKFSGQKKKASQTASPFPEKRLRVPPRCNIMIPQQPRVVNTFLPSHGRKIPAIRTPRLERAYILTPSAPPAARCAAHSATGTTPEAPHNPFSFSLRTLPKM